MENTPPPSIPQDWQGHLASGYRDLARSGVRHFPQEVKELFDSRATLTSTTPEEGSATSNPPSATDSNQQEGKAQGTQESHGPAEAVSSPPQQQASTPVPQLSPRDFAISVYKCEQCGICSPRHRAAINPPRPSDIMVLAAYPTSPQSSGKLFTSGEADSLLNRLFGRLGHQSTHYSYALKGLPQAAPTQQQIHTCLQHLLQEILHVKPKVIFCFGDLALASILKISHTQPPIPIMGFGHAVPILMGAFNTVAVPGPSSIELLHNPSWRKDVWEYCANRLREFVN